MNRLFKNEMFDLVKLSQNWLNYWSARDLCLTLGRLLEPSQRSHEGEFDRCAFAQRLKVCRASPSGPGLGILRRSRGNCRPHQLVGLESLNRREFLDQTGAATGSLRGRRRPRAACSAHGLSPMRRPTAEFRR